MELNFVPVNPRSLGEGGTTGRHDWVFLCPEYAETAGSLISTYRVVNTTLRAESEISGWEGKMSRPESFSYQV